MRVVESERFRKFLSESLENKEHELLPKLKIENEHLVNLYSNYASQKI